MRNYIADRNPFQLAAPPAWALRKLADFDPDLVILPSRQRPMFWLARRKKYSIGFTGTPLEGYDPAPDTRMFVTHGVVSVIDFVSFNWSESAVLGLLRWLHERDTWRDDGPLDEDRIKTLSINDGSKFTKRVEDQDREIERRKAALQRETVYHHTGDAWRSLQARRGARILNAGQPSTVSRPNLVTLT